MEIGCLFSNTEIYLITFINLALEMLKSPNYTFIFFSNTGLYLFLHFINRVCVSQLFVYDSEVVKTKCRHLFSMYLLLSSAVEASTVSYVTFAFSRFVFLTHS